ncbi:hypothetical protein GLYMA_06G289700v4 [Glycine max]|uniref:Uncharacterized protein n=1 Tax=Glycine max TaxID=3847 RepID=I1KEZ1_SOYBN|nr:hypothetical protein GYH30_016574 [Glycine max]KRH55916.1 hypothetical protein GLYMA_06G289700v4 [Glycine max]
MDAIGSGCWGLWKWNPLPQSRRRRIRSNSGSADAAGGGGYRFPVKQAVTAASLALTGDTIAQLSHRWRKAKEGGGSVSQDELWRYLSDHDWLRALRMTSYGFLLYGPGSYAWYQCLDHCLPKPTVQNLVLKVHVSLLLFLHGIIYGYRSSLSFQKNTEEMLFQRYFMDLDSGSLSVY